MTKIAGGISWAENLAFDGLGSLFATDRLKGAVVRIQFDAATNSYTQTNHLTGMQILLGLSVDPSSGGAFMYTVGRNATGTSVLIRFNTQVPQQWEQVLSLSITTRDCSCKHFAWSGCGVVWSLSTLTLKAAQFR